MFGIGSTELAIILIFAFLLFGPDKLPGMGRTIGRMLRQFREAQESVTQVVQSEVMDPLSEAMMGEEPEARKTSRAAAAAAAQADADLDDAEVAPTHAETFAERRARLKAEKEAREAEEAAAAAVAEAPADVASDEDLPEEPAAPADAAPEAAVMDVPAAEAAGQPEASAEEPAAEPVSAPSKAPVDLDSDLDADAPADTTPAQESEPTMPDTSAAALYNLTPRKEGGDAR